MFAIIENGKFTGVTYDEITPHVQAWLTKYGASYIETDEAPVNIGTDEEPDYGAPMAEQLVAATEAAAFAAIDNLVSTTFKSRGYNSDTGSLSRYLNMTDEDIAAQPAAYQPLSQLFRAEAQALDNWYPLVYAYGGAIKAGLLPRPATIEELIDGAPKMEWPAGSEPR